jgi:hypothetical protein
MKMVEAAETIPAGRGVHLSATRGQGRELAYLVDDLEQDDVHGVAPKEIVAGKRGFIAQPGDTALLAVGGNTAHAVGDNITNGGDDAAYFGTGGGKTYGTWLSLAADGFAVGYLQPVDTIYGIVPG